MLNVLQRKYLISLVPGGKGKTWLQRALDQLQGHNIALYWGSMHDQNMIKTLFLKPATTKHGSEMEEYERKREKPIPACIWPILAEIFAKNMKRLPPSSEIVCVNQIDRDLKKRRKQQFYLRTSSRCKYLPNIFCHNIFQKIFGARLTWQDSTRPSTSFAWPL